MLTGIIAIFFYLGAAGYITSRLHKQQGPNIKIIAVLAAISLLTHLATLSNEIFIAPGQNMSMLNVASLLTWVIAISMSLASYTMSSAILLPVVYSSAALALLAGLLIPTTHIVHFELRPNLIIHITLALLAYGCLVIALLYALQTSYINARLKQKQASLLHSSLPPLMQVETILFKLLATGTLLLTLSLISGFVFLDNMFDKEQAHKTVLSIVAWGIFCLTLFGHYRLGWRRKTLVSMTIAGTAILTLAYFGSRFVKEVILS